MEFSSGPIPTPLPQYRYQAKAIITLYPPNVDDDPSLARTTSRGSIGRRLSFGSNRDKDHDEGHDAEKGGGLRSFARRLSMGGTSATSEGGGAGTGTGGATGTTGATGATGATQTTPGAPLSRTKSKDLKANLTGKWATNVEIAVTPTHLLLILSPDHPLAPFPPPAGAPGYVAPRRRNSASRPSTSEPGTTGAADEEKTEGGIGQKIKNIFHRKSSTAPDTQGGAAGGVTKPSAGAGISESAFVEEDSPAAITRTTGAEVGTASPPTGQNQHPVLPLAPTPSQATPQFPAYVGGKPTTHVLVPIAAIKENEVKITTEKGEMAVRVPVTSHFSSLVHPMMDTLGRESEESWGRSGKIKFQFDRNWIGAKGEAEVLQHNIIQACENRRATSQSTTLNLGGGATATTGGGWAAPQAPVASAAGGGGTAISGQQRAGHGTTDVDPFDTSSEAKVAGVAT
jgi:hypothetical protein